MTFFRVNGSERIRISLAPFDVTASKIDSFSQLPQGWHFGEGGPLGLSTIQKAIKLHIKAKMCGLQTDAFPGFNGEIQVSCYHGQETLTFTIEETGVISFLFERGTEEIEHAENLSVEWALDKITENVGTIVCDLSDSSIPTIMRRPRRDSATWRSRTQPAAGYRLFRATV
jgi:hypothetical protein